MQNRHHIENKIEEALSSLDEIRRASPRPYLHTRVMARLQRERSSVWEQITGLLSRPIVAFAGIAIIVAANLFALYDQNRNSNSTATREISISDEYNPSSAVASLYDYEK